MQANLSVARNTLSPGGESFRVSFSPNGIEVSARITDAASADELIRSINALKLLLRPASEIKKPNEEAAHEAGCGCFLVDHPSDTAIIFNVPRSDVDARKPTSDSTRFCRPAERKSGSDRSCTWINFPLRTVPRHKPSP
jgi:hypothetical protein